MELYKNLHSTPQNDFIWRINLGHPVFMYYIMRKKRELKRVHEKKLLMPTKSLVSCRGEFKKKLNKINEQSIRTTQTVGIAQFIKVSTLKYLIKEHVRLLTLDFDSTMFVYFPVCSFIFLTFFPFCSFIPSCLFIPSWSK